ncbi:MAG: asparaginase [Cellulomonadaceae bacterium]|jgi:L-asparaginase II|nr:asparaginase [Cellulomonadaceae bacterium]
MGITEFGAPQAADGSLISGAGLLARVERGDITESAHLGHLIILGKDGRTILKVGDPNVTIYPRSSLKPLQLLASLRAGFDPDDEALVALAASSHNGEPEHLEGAREILHNIGLDETALDNTPGTPLDPQAAFEWKAQGREAEAIAQNCSGKHAAMLAACVASGWPVAGYRDVEHPLQKLVAATIKELTGDAEPPHITTDGCGAPLFSTSLVGLARAFGRIATAPPGTDEARIAAAMAAHPHMVGGTGRDVTAAMQAVPGLICKDGAEGVYAGALADGTAFAFKVLDGSGRPRPAILARVLELAGVADLPGVDLAAMREIGTVPVLGHGNPVGLVRPAF